MGQLDWRSRLTGDPAAWLLDESDNPSIFFWFLRDIVGRPEDSPSLLEARERILFSAPVQAVFKLQDPSGYWESPNSLDLPRYGATLWMLALLAELGLPRESRRASLACEFILQAHVNSDGAFTGLRDTNAAGLAARSLCYFRQNDPRLVPVLFSLQTSARDGQVFALWALAESRRVEFERAVLEGREKLVEGIARGAYTVLGAFPPFEEHDLLLALRVLRLVGVVLDARVDFALEQVWRRQGKDGRWSLEIDYAQLLPIELEKAHLPSKWATLNVLRAVGAATNHAAWLPHQRKNRG